MRNDMKIQLSDVFIENASKRSFDDIQKFYAENYIIDKTPIVNELYFRVNSDEHKYFMGEKSFLRMIENTQAFYRVKALDKSRYECEMMFCLSEAQPVLCVDRFYCSKYDELLSKIYEEEKKMFMNDIDVYVTKPIKHKARNMLYSEIVYVANRYVKYEKIPTFFKGFDIKNW